MFKHYLTTALRHFRQQRVTTGINVACLALGLACFILAWGMVAYFEKADSYHARAERTHFVTARMSASPFTLVTTPWILAETLKAEFPQLESVARSLNGGELPVSVGDHTSFVAIAFADPQFIRIFDLPLTAGSAATALDNPRSAIVSTALARRLFGTENVMGRTLRVANKEDVTITGVIASIPQPSHISVENTQARLYFEMLLSMDTHIAITTTLSPTIAKAEFSRWNVFGYLTYFVLPNDNTLTKSQLDAQLNDLLRRRVPTTDGAPTFSAHSMADLTRLLLNTFVGADFTGVSSTAILQLLGSLVLLVSCLNYANLATAQAATRAKEVALQKIVGASFWQVLVQHFVEASILVWLALALAIAGVGLIALSAGTATFAGLAILFVRMPQFWLCIALLLLVVSLVVCAYPALVLARVRPIHALQSSRVKAGSRFTSTLVGLQSGSASFLIIAVFVMIAQNQTTKRAVENSANDPIVVIANDIKGAALDQSTLKSELLKISGIVAVSGIQAMPWTATLDEVAAVSATPEFSKTDVMAAQKRIVAADFFSALQIPILAGREFERDRKEDATEVAAMQFDLKPAALGFNVVIDHTLAKKLGYTNLSDAVGKTIYGQTSYDASTPPLRLNVIGVVEDSMLKPSSYGTASFYLFNPSAATVPVIRISKSNIESTLRGIDEVWARLAPHEPIKRRFADEQFEKVFGFLRLISGTFSVLAGFASVIAVIGLIGMALHVIRRRTHEIGVRKTLGASVSRILWLLLRSFSKPIVIANLLAWPIVYVAMRGYLSLFTVQSGLTLMPFAMSLFIMLAIAWLAVVVQAARAARMNPATVLRHE
jgi:putative ABC transport system permease protein